MADEKEAPEDSELTRKLQAYVSFFHNAPSGRLVLADLKASLDGETYWAGMRSEDSIFLQGRRSVYLDIITAIGAGEIAVESAGEQRPAEVETLWLPGALGEPLE